LKLRKQNLTNSKRSFANRDKKRAGLMSLTDKGPIYESPHLNANKYANEHFHYLLHALRRGSDWKKAACLLVNIWASCAVVFANKFVFAITKFEFTVALTCIHTLTTLGTAQVLYRNGVIHRKPLPTRAVSALAAAFTGYIVLCNVSLLVNTVGFYQLTKIMIAPTILVLNSIADKQLPSFSVTLCVLVVCAGVALATLSDKQVVTNMFGAAVGAVSVVVSAIYGMWIGSMTKQHDATSMQLLDQYLPYAACMMAACVPLESWALRTLKPGHPSLLDYDFSPISIAAIALSSSLGAVVTFSTFLVIDQTSALTYAVVGHVKTAMILGGGVFFFGDVMTLAKALGVAMAIAGVIAYSQVK
jgi:solute carrier family 35, member E3